jgi:hypothetical protein
MSELGLSVSRSSTRYDRQRVVYRRWP